MPYLIKALDFSDALPRRMEVREKHLEGISALKAQKKVLYAAALMNERNELAGSMLIVDLTMPEIQEMLKSEPYILNRVWNPDHLEITACRPAPGF